MQRKLEALEAQKQALPERIARLGDISGADELHPEAVRWVMKLREALDSDPAEARRLPRGWIADRLRAYPEGSRGFRVEGMLELRCVKVVAGGRFGTRDAA